jgi:hypothetical protein
MGDKIYRRFKKTIRSLGWANLIIISRALKYKKLLLKWIKNVRISLSIRNIWSKIKWSLLS